MPPAVSISGIGMDVENMVIILATVKVGRRYEVGIVLYIFNFLIYIILFMKNKIRLVVSDIEKVSVRQGALTN